MMFPNRVIVSSRVLLSTAVTTASLRLATTGGKSSSRKVLRTCLFQHHPVSYFSTDTTNIIINAVGADRLGIVSDVSKAVIDCGGNVGESVAGRLGTHFSLMMLVTVPSTAIDTLKDVILTVPDINAAVFNAGTTSIYKDITPTVGYSGKFVLEGADNPGIVHRVTTALAKNSLNIDQLITEQELAPYGGAVLFKMRGTVVATAPLAKNFDIQKIKLELAELGDTLNCDLSLEDTVDEQYEGSFYAG